MNHLLSTSTASLMSGLNETEKTDKTTSTHNDTFRKAVTTVCLVGRCSEDFELRKALDILGLTVVTSINGGEFFDDPDVAFVFDEFTGFDFKNAWIAKRKQVYGPTAIKEFANARQPLRWTKQRPLFCRSMEGIVVLFSLTQRAILHELVDLVHFMGGSVREAYTDKVTHLVSQSTQKEKYRVCVASGRPVMSVDWIRKAWEKRHIVQSYAFSDEMKRYKLPAFYNLKLAFYGFSLEESGSMQLRAGELGADITLPCDCTHYIINTHVDELTVPARPNEFCRLVSSDWFWASLHMETSANESEYTIQRKQANGSASPLSYDLSNSKQRSSKGRSSFEPSNGTFFQDTSCSLPDHMFSVDDLESMVKSPQKPGENPPKPSRRRMICGEMLDTERNYVQVLRTVTTIFKEPLLKVDPFGNRILDLAEVKMIFGNVGDILEVHEKICEQLMELIANWDEKRCIGRVWLDHQEELKICYPPFVNFFEKAMETLELCTDSNLRFQAFLKACQSKPECARQRLKDLLIRPVQRLPSVSLLLTDLLKHTDKVHEDSQLLQDAINGLEQVLTHVNESKRKIDGQMEMFRIMNDIQDCPNHLLSAHRQLIIEIEASDLSGAFTKKKSSVLSFYLFNDCLEIAKKSQKKSAEGSKRRQTMVKSKKHKILFLLTRVRRVSNIFHCSESSDLFCLTARGDYRDNNYVFLFRGIVERSDSPAGSNTNLSSALSKEKFLDLLTDYVTRAGRSDVRVDYNAEGQVDCNVGTDVQNAIRRIKGHEGTLTRTSSTLKRPGSSASSLRRSISSAFVGTMRRMVSTTRIRIPLQEIMEEASKIPQNRRQSILPKCETTNGDPTAA